MAATSGDCISVTYLQYLSLMKELGESVPDTPKQVMSSVLPSPAASLVSE